jgi:hypothetical protein
MYDPTAVAASSFTATDWIFYGIAAALVVIAVVAIWHEQRNK